MNLRKIENKLNELQKGLTEIVKELKRNEKWEPEDGERFYYIANVNDTYVIRHDLFEKEGNFANQMFSTSNCFKTETEALKELKNLQIETEKEQLIEELQSGPHELDWDYMVNNIERIYKTSK
jgi:hypothetical protein